MGTGMVSASRYPEVRAVRSFKNSEITYAVGPRIESLAFELESAMFLAMAGIGLQIYESEFFGGRVPGGKEDRENRGLDEWRSGNVDGRFTVVRIDWSDMIPCKAFSRSRRLFKPRHKFLILLNQALKLESAIFVFLKSSVMLFRTRHSEIHSHLRPIRALRALLPAQFAKSLERGKVPLGLTLKRTFRRRPDEKHVTSLDILRFVAYTNGALATRTDDDTGAFDTFKGGLCSTLLQLGLHDAEFLDWRVVENGAGGGAIRGLIEGTVGVVGWGHFLLRGRRVAVCQHGG